MAINKLNVNEKLLEDGSIIVYGQSSPVRIKAEVMQNFVNFAMVDSKLGTTNQIAKSMGISKSYIRKAMVAMRFLGFEFEQAKSGTCWFVTERPAKLPDIYLYPPENDTTAPTSEFEPMPKRPMPELPPHRELGNSIIISKEAYYAWANAWQFIYPEYDTLVDIFNGD